LKFLFSVPEITISRDSCQNPSGQEYAVNGHGLPTSNIGEYLPVFAGTANTLNGFAGIMDSLFMTHAGTRVYRVLCCLETAI